MPSDAVSHRPTFSIIIPTYNEERFIRQCLESLLAQSYPREMFDIIVVDNGSTDCTLPISQQGADVILRHPGLRIGALRNRGAAVASGQFLAFLDADCQADSEWLACAARSLLQERSVTGGSYSIPENPHWIEQAWFAQEHRGRRATRLLPGGNLIVPRDAFGELGGFDESLVTGEDAEFCQRARKLLPVIADDTICVIHLGNPKTLRKFLERETWHGMGALGSLKTDWRDKPLFGTILFAILTLAQIVGLLLALFSSSGTLLLYSTIGVGALLAATVGYRLSAVHDWSSLPALVVLYYLYYLGRTRSLLRVIRGQKFSRREK